MLMLHTLGIIITQSVSYIHNNVKHRYIVNLNSLHNLNLNHNFHNLHLNHNSNLGYVCHGCLHCVLNYRSFLNLGFFLNNICDTFSRR